MTPDELEAAMEARAANPEKWGPGGGNGPQPNDPQNRYMPREADMPSAVSASPTFTCVDCSAQIEGPPKRLLTRDGPPRFYCEPCWGAYFARLEVAKAQRALVADVNRVLAQFPKWDGANVGNEAYMNKVDPRLVRMIRGWKPEHSHVWICGLTGSDKTMSLRALVHRWGDEVIASGVPDPVFSGIVWAKAYRLVESIKWHKLGSGEPPEMTHARDATVLFLDDLGQEQPGLEHVLFGLINDRYEQQKPTLVTCGLTIQEVGDRYGQHLYRRLCEKSVGTIIDLFPRRGLEVVK